MELEQRLKITRIAKNGGGLIFLYRETEAVFFLIAHLRGYRANDVYVNINEDGTQISVTELRGFSKVFRIPEGVVLDQIKAKFDEEESVLTISMPKSVKGISGSVVGEIVAGAVVDATENEDQSGRKKKGSLRL